MQTQPATTALMMDDIDDPLSTLEHHLYQEHTQHNQRALFTHLHDITLRFEDDRRYRNDTRYIRIWLKYASFFEDRSWIYEHMHHKRIGEYVGAYYEHAAEYYAIHKNRWKHAEELLRLGIQNKAEPLSHLHQTLLHIRQKQLPNGSKFIITFKDRPATNSAAAPNTPLPPITNSTNQLLRHRPLVISQGRQQQQQQHVGQVIREGGGDVDMDAIRRQQLRMQIVQECYCGTEILSFEELRAQLQHRYCRNQQRLDEVKQEEADNEKVGLRIVSHYDRQKTSYHGIGSHSEEARQNVAPTPAETAQLDRHNEEASDNSNNNIRTGHHHYHQPPHGDTRTTTTTTSATAAHVASIPPASHFIRTKLAHLSPPFQSYTGFHDFTPLPLKRIQANKILHLEDGMAVRIFHKIAQGGFARVYLAETSKGNASCAIKVETPANPWEFYILRQLQTRLIDHDDRYDKGDAVTERRLWRQSIIQAYGFYLYNDGSYLVLEHANQGTLLDCFNAYRTQHLRSTMPETLALFFIIRLLQAVQTIHAVGIIHGDIKMDNVMVAFEEQSTLPQRFDDSDEEWQKQYLVLIDFGRAMDLTLLPDNVYLKADWSPQPADSLAVRQGLAFRPRAIDYYGLASIAHWLLFGKAMSIVEKQAQKEGGGWQIQERWKRYWHSELWQQLFELLLNPPADDKLSDTLIAKVTKMGQQILQQDKNLAIRVAQLIVQSSY